jgi:hypothetical protein
MQSLSDLKAQNEAEEQARQQAAEAQAEPVLEEESEEEEVEDVSEAEVSEGEPEGEQSEVEEWQKAEDEVAPMFYGSDVAAAKKKLRAKLERRHESETEELKAQISELQKQVSNPVQQAPKVQPRPKYSDYDTEEAYEEALDSWYDQKVEAKLSGRDERLSQQRKQAEAQQKVSSSVDQHYERAAKLTQDHGINQEVYHSADLAVRQMVENIRPGHGDMTVDLLISNLGQDSEKVMFYVGRNAQALSELQSSLVGDPSGIQAAMLLGSMKARVAMPNKRQSKAPKPATQLKGDEAVKDKSSLERKLKKKYQESHKSGNAQAAWNSRSEARRSGIDVSNWS